MKKSVPVGGALLPNVALSHVPKKAQLRAPLSPLQTAWTGFDPNLYRGGSSSAGPALVEIATARSFILNRGIVPDNFCHTPGARMVSSAFHSTKAVVSQVGALRTGLQACGDWLLHTGCQLMIWYLLETVQALLEVQCTLNWVPCGPFLTTG